MSLSIFPATRSQTNELHRQTWSQWAKGLSVDEYLEAHAQRDSWEVAKDGKLITWVLAPRNDPETLDFLCSCETFRRVGVFNGAQVVCYAIASVFTPERYRNKGYATLMMRLLHWVLAREDLLPIFPEELGSPPQRVEAAGDGLFSALWSAIGPEFYKKCGLGDGDGWVVHSPMSTIWPVKPAEQTSAWEWLDANAVDALWTSETIGMISHMPNHSFSFLPSNGVGSYHRLMVQLWLQKAGRNIEYWGVRNEDALATWSFLRSTLLITYIRSTPSAFSSLLNQLHAIASKYGMEKIEIWNLPRDLGELTKETGGEEVERKEHLPSVKVYAKEEGMEWVHNERFCWC